MKIQLAIWKKKILNDNSMCNSSLKYENTFLNLEFNIKIYNSIWKKKKIKFKQKLLHLKLSRVFDDIIQTTNAFCNLFLNISFWKCIFAIDYTIVKHKILIYGLPKLILFSLKFHFLEIIKLNCTF